MSEDGMTEDQARELLRDISSGQQNLHSFLSKIITADSTTKTGNLDKEELGDPKLPVRTYEELALFSRDVAEQEDWADYFSKMSEIQTKTSLSKDAILLKLAVNMKKELADVSPKRKENKGWFKKKNEGAPLQ